MEVKLLAKSRDNQSGSRVVLGDHYADIVADPTSNERIFWVVQKFGCSDVIAWGQERTLRAAQQAVYQCLHEQRALNAKQTG